MTDTSKNPIDDSKEELSEAELDQVAGGIGHMEAHPALRRGEPSPAAVRQGDPAPSVKSHKGPGEGVQPAASVGRTKGI
jgi:hypothetical protein